MRLVNTLKLIDAQDHEPSVIVIPPQVFFIQGSDQTIIQGSDQTMIITNTEV